MSYFRKPNPKSTWKRPKPKIYDCNTRDLENFYKSNYNDYLSLKNEFRGRDLDDRGNAEELTRRFEQRRASSLVYGEDDTPRTHRLIPNRQISTEGNSEHSTSSYLRNRTGQSENSMSGSQGRSSMSKSVTFSSSSDTGSEMAGIEQRLDRLKRLREELGLPSEVEVDGIASPSENTNESSSRRQFSSSARSSSLSRSSPTENSYSSKTRSALRNGLGDEESSSYTSRTSRFKAPENSEETSYSRTSKYSSTSKDEEPSGYTSRTTKYSSSSKDDEPSGYTSRTSKYSSSVKDDEPSGYSSRTTKYSSSTKDDEPTSSYTSRTSKYSSSTKDDDSSTYTPRTSRFKTDESNGVEYESSALKSRQKVARPNLDDDLKYDDEMLLADMKKKIPSSSEILERIKNMDID